MAGIAWPPSITATLIAAPPLGPTRSDGGPLERWLLILSLALSLDVNVMRIVMATMRPLIMNACSAAWPVPQPGSKYAIDTPAPTGVTLPADQVYHLRPARRDPACQRHCQAAPGHTRPQ